MPVLATWNINSVRARLDQVLRLAAEDAPDVIALQEIKCRDDQFPAGELERAGYVHQAVYGNKGHHGVAVVSRHAFEAGRQSFCDRVDGRCLVVRFAAEGPLKGLKLANFYVPAGGDVPDPALNERFAHKLAFLDEWAAWSARYTADGAPALLMGDLNVAPLDTDVWSHRQLLGVVSHTPIEVEKLNAVQHAGGWIDVMRRVVPPEVKLFTWWSYRALDWRASNRGRRLDHVWATAALDGAWTGLTVKEATRDWAKPSDHVPVLVRLGL